MKSVANLAAPPRADQRQLLVCNSEGLINCSLGAEFFFFSLKHHLKVFLNLRVLLVGSGGVGLKCWTVWRKGCFLPAQTPNVQE